MKSQKVNSNNSVASDPNVSNMQEYSGKSNAQEVDKMKQAMDKNKTSFSSTQQVSIPSIASVSHGTTPETTATESEGTAVDSGGSGVSQSTSAPPADNGNTGNAGAGSPNAVTAEVGDKTVAPESATPATPETQTLGPSTSEIPSASGPGVLQTPSGPSSNSDGISAEDVNFGMDIVNGTTQTPTASTPSTGTETGVPSTSTPSSSTPSYDDNRAPIIRAMWLQNNRLRWDDIVNIDINGSDPNWDPLSWKLDWSGTNGFSHTEEIGFPDADKPSINNWIQTALPLAGTGLKKGDKLTCTATVFDPSGLSDTQSYVVEVRNAPPEIKSVTPDKNEYLMTDVAKVEIVAEDLDLDDLYWTYNWAGTDVKGSGTEGPGDVLTIEVDLNEARVLPGGELRGFVEVDDKDGGTDSENFALPVVDIENQIDEIGAVEVWFTSGNAVDTNIEVNDPPQIDMLGLQHSAVIPGGSTRITGQASDPENMDLTWSWTWTGKGVNQSGSNKGNNISLPNMGTAANSVPGQDVYRFTATVNDGFLDSEAKSIDLPVNNLPPVIESLSMPNRVALANPNFTLSGDGMDPMGSDELLDWTVIPSGGIRGGTRQIENQEKFSLGLGAGSSGSVRVILTNDAGLTDERTLGMNTYDPIVFDLNRDGKVDVVGGEIAEKEISMPAGEWTINTEKQGGQSTRYVLNDVNLGAGAHVADNAFTTEVHATRRWKLGVEQMSGDEDWSPVDITNDPSLKMDEGTKNGSGISIIEAGGARLKATRISDLGYEDDGLGVNSVAGDMVLFDIDPTKWSWSDGSPDLRPGLQNNTVVPKHPGGYAEYDSGQKENIPQSGVWIEDPSKGNSAKIYNAAGEWVAEWVGGEETMYYWGTREDRERTQWVAGNGDGMLVWDKNNDGIISDSTELMSEFNAEGERAFADGWEKLSHYFDKDGDGIVQGSEMDGLKMWVDDGDAQSEAGELMELADYGIFSIEIPQGGSWVSSAQALGVNSTVQLGFMAVLTRSPTSAEYNKHVDSMSTGQSLKDFVAELLATDEFQGEVAARGINDVIFDMIKNLLHKIPSAEEVANGVAEYNAGKAAEYVITLMNDPSVIERFKADQASA